MLHVASAILLTTNQPSQADLDSMLRFPFLTDPAHDTVRPAAFTETYRIKRLPKLPFHLSAAVLLLAAFTLSPAGKAQQATSAAPTDAEVNRFVDDLLSRMTLAEKIGQTEQSAGQTMYVSTAEQDRLTRSGEVGSFLFHTDPETINHLQKVAVTESRLHIPLLFGYDVIHGFRTIAPIPLAMASSWDPDLVTRTQAMAAAEARAAGVHWAFAPMVDIARDARWGRIMESAGEDPVLGEAMAAAQVRGFQGPFVGSPDHVLASTKHFAGYGAAEGGRDYESSDISDELLYNVYLRPYHAAVNAGSATIMSAYMDLNGVPATGNRWLLQDVLRKDWGFTGFVVSDWDAVKNLEAHGFASSPADAAVRAFSAGVNMEMTSSVYRQFLPEAVKSGRISEANVNDMVRPILAAKYRLGLFSNPYVDLNHFKQVTGSEGERTAVREAAEQTAVLLRNEAHTLPLSKSIRSVAVIGPLADSKVDTLGSWSIHGDRDRVVTIAGGIREKLPQAQVSVSLGVEITRGAPTIFDEQFPPAPLTLLTPEARAAEFQHALALARAADTTVLVLGEAQTMNGEAASRASLTLPGEQQRLLEAVAALGKPVVLVLMTGRPLDITWASEHVPAILNVWYPGSEGGHAVANLLFGDANPSGHLPVTWPRSAGQEPLFYNAKLPMDPENNARRYWDLSSAPLYPFGYGLSYANITLADLKLTSPTVSTSQPLSASVTLTNASDRPGAEVVQLYTHQRSGSTTRPARELKAFRKVTLAPHATETVTLTLSADDLSFWSASLRRRTLEAGPFDLWIGTDSTATLHSTFNLTTP